ncbi:bifunctional protein-disulfide isomerase/oxidoreductase DsbC [Pasteurella oralis]|uniref:Thiol:disulfide interchange protein n=1 Tax=Pasteurella oralis TaxID=1071947 RepID=A0ABW4NU18_9PAST|nr:bifunctional protein-disulfide isomerase/oxidoreductase DsbC [Pasteurella oralis]MDO5053772.1 bifunctional protein-disulfide isomerase/oxidoreductase DsbC [Pasteurella oralis]
MKKFLAVLVGLTLSAPLFASTKAISERLNHMGIKNVELKDSPVNGLKTAITEQGIFYITEDAKYVVDGKLYELSDKGVTDVSAGILLEQLNKFDKEMIVYPAKNEKHVVTVFMDISCHYCKVLHEKIKGYNDLGITVRYLAFPRAGINSKVARQMETIFTAKDPQFALNEAEKGHFPKELKTPDIVKKHYQLGLQFGVNGTPAIITPTGELIGGYLEPKALLAELNRQ